MMQFTMLNQIEVSQQMPCDLQQHYAKDSTRELKERKVRKLIFLQSFHIKI